MLEEKKDFELNDEELEGVVGGYEKPVGDRFYFAYTYPSQYCGEWFQKVSEPDFAYTVYSSGQDSYSFVANKYWYKNGEAWPFGTCSFGVSDIFVVVPHPTIIHEDFTGAKPF